VPFFVCECVLSMTHLLVSECLFFWRIHCLIAGVCLIVTPFVCCWRLYVSSIGCASRVFAGECISHQSVVPLVCLLASVFLINRLCLSCVYRRVYLSSIGCASRVFSGECMSHQSVVPLVCLLASVFLINLGASSVFVGG
jgi:multidrug transporter EmrE-like cation transporter